VTYLNRPFKVQKTLETINAKRLALAVSIIMMAVGIAPCHAVTAAPQTLEGVIGGWLKAQTLQHSNVGVEVMELPSGKVLYSYNGRKRFVPASTAKVFTTACAFETLGGNYTYKTQLLSAGTITDGKLHGDIVINSSQDPSLSRDDIRQLVSKIDTKKLNSVDGRVRLAKTPGGFEQYLPGWLVEDFGQIYMPVCSNFVVDHNIAQGVSGMKGARVFDMSSTYEINAMTRSLMKSDVASAWLTYDPGNKTIRTYCGEGTNQKSPLMIADPDEYNVALVEQALAEKGIHVEKSALMSRDKSNTSDGATTLLAEHISNPLSKICTITLHESDNLYAQQLLRTLGMLTPEQMEKTKNKEDETTLEQRGLYRLMNWLSSAGVPQQESVILDGCGLTRKNGLTPHALNLVLKHMAGPTVTGPYLSLLKNGDNFRYKTGSMDTARSITGVVTTAGGQNLAVTIMVNNHTPSIKDLRAAVGELVNIVGRIKTITIKEPGKPEVTELPTSDVSGPVLITMASPAPAAVRHASRRGHKRRRH
jgi:serine-type D-Ala-D-Ala carboxypeptidase/endopeptidase (penicillin-binding protein 4)